MSKQKIFCYNKTFVLFFSIAGLSVCSILVALIGLSYLLFDPIVKYVILGRLVLRNESDFAELWKKPPITPHFKVNFIYYIKFIFENL